MTRSCSLPPGPALQVEKLLGEVGQLPQEVATSPMSNETLDERCRMLERLASEVSRLHYNAARAQASPPLGCRSQGGG